MLSVIIVNYRSWGHLNNCLNSLLGIDGLEIIVVDNFSDDGELGSFAKGFKTAKFIASKINLGFGGACNLGAKEAKNENLLFLNPDTIANQTALQTMQKFMVENDFKVVSCQQHENIKKHFLLFPNLLRTFGLLRAIAVAINKEKFKIKTLNNNKYIEPDWVSGSVIMTTKTWHNYIGGWSPQFWMYSEDLDFCKKTAHKNGKIALLTDVQIYHKHGGATRKNIETAAITKAEVIKSKHVYYQKYFGTIENILAQLVLVLSLIFIRTPMAILGLLFNFVPKMKLQTEIFKNLLPYYLFAIKNKSWLSEKLVKYDN